MKMKTVQSAPIVQIVQEFSTTGGVETVALELSRAFSRAHMANCVLASKVDGVVISGTNVEMVGSVLAKLPTRGALRYIGRALVVPLFTVAATLAARRYASSVIISHGDSLAGDILVIHAVNAASLAEKRRDGGWRWRLNPMHVWVALRDRWMIGGLRYRRYVAVSRRVQEELQHYYKVPQARIQIIPNGIDLERFKPAPQTRSDMRAAFNIPAKAKVLLFAGHEFGRKGLEYVIRAMDMVDDDIWLMVVGSDNPEPYRQIAPGLKERIIFAGSRKNMPDFYAAADAFVFPTNYETFSLVCMEALASGLPILATRVGGIEDYLQEGGNGYFITRAPAAIADKIRMVFADPANYLKLSAGAVATAQTYGWDAVAAQYLALIAEVANEKARSDPESPAKNGA
eukprot:gene12674-12768_t